ncbi:TPA: DNA topoisomerase [Clostridium botulinum]|nr:DNA topoisomerase [Clostridium botulinum]HBJ1652728.1 DNA topoisomerase [Clostridium botulinum]
MTNTYNTDSIESLGILGGVRAKPASIGLESHSHTFVEILMNSIDEYREGHGKQIIVTKYKDNSISIQDFGRSLPMGKNSKGEYAYKKIFEEMWSGGKYKNNSKTENGNYKWSCGTNGLGIFGSSACSDFLEATAFAPNNKKYHIRYEKGIQVGEFEETNHGFDYTGTIIHWIPSKEVFKGENNIDNDFILSILQQQAIINDDLKFIFKDETTDEELIYHYPKGATDYIKEIDKKENSLMDILKLSTEAEGSENKDDEIYAIKANLTFTFNNDINLIQYYHNSSFLENGGTPQDFIKNGFTYSIDKYINEKNLYKPKEKKITFEDIQDSLIIISDTYSTISLYTDQAKKKIKSKFMQSHVTEFIKEQIYIYFTENPLISKIVCNQILINKRAREHAEVTKKNIKQKLQGQKKGLKLKVEGLRDCDMSNSELNERIFIVDEGISANSTIADSFDNRIMGCLGLRGRFINSLKKGCSISDVLNNQPALGIIQAMGAGIEIPRSELKKYESIESFNINNLRYGSIAILCDSDAFGYGISLSILTFLYKYMPTLVEQGRVYFVISPRFEITDKKDNVHYVYNEQEKQLKINEIGKNNIKSIGIKKGLGEFDKEEFWEYVLSPKAREKSFIKILYNKNLKEQINYYFNMLMGDDIDNRKQFIKDKIVNVNVTELD